ncbi:carboxylesterase/lipase family protein [Deinococcus multiflagellatus]|uniref:carboxylesterase/lipase family protein n=1 Tax=Deinococcus multiflagellatus TaxID=1656887 RepID=UPI001CD01C67|nr:carboxylesterase family protein [Deinococcus multiflagellatus]MBZ9712021.1 carboxylesterase family protein [Deinococcus multiflagellatus]
MATGRLQGLDLRVGTQAARTWLGVPYAAPACGPLRFAPPQPHPGWTGVRDARAYAPDVLQPLDPSVTLARPAEGSLALNIWAPPEGCGHPVLLWLHGGAFRAGSGRLYDGREYAARHGVVVVTVNSRLGPLGYANFGGLFGDERFTPNAGYQDQVAALRWVAANIAAFGGDPARITVGGQSAGAVAAALMLRDPQAAPWIAGAILQSGTLNQVSPWDNSLALAQAYADVLGVGPRTVDRLLTLPPGAFVRALHRLEQVRPRRLNSRPFLDGRVLPGGPEALLAAPAAPVPLLLGAAREDYSLFVKVPDRIFPRTDRALLTRVMVPHLAPGQVRAVLAQYPDTPDGLVALGTDLFFHVGNDALLGAHPPAAPVYRYRFDWGTRLFGLGATHGMDLLFLWPRPLGHASGLLRGGEAGRRTDLARQMQTAWAAFVHRGSPGPDWPAYSAPAPQVAALSLSGLTLSTAGEQARRALWQDTLVPMP